VQTSIYLCKAALRIDSSLWNCRCCIVDRYRLPPDSRVAGFNQRASSMSIKLELPCDCFVGGHANLLSFPEKLVIERRNVRIVDIGILHPVKPCQVAFGQLAQFLRVKSVALYDSQQKKRVTYYPRFCLPAANGMLQPASHKAAYVYLAAPVFPVFKFHTYETKRHARMVCRSRGGEEYLRG
jgi:hypothetical protein